MRERGRSARPLGRAGTVLVWAAAAASVAFTVVRAFGIDHQYILATLVSFTPYIAAAAVIPILVAWLLRRWLPALLSLVAFAVLVSLVLPRAIAGGPHPNGPRLRLLTVNMHGGHISPERLVALASRERVDVVAVEESTQRVKGTLIAAGLTRLLPFTDLQRYDTGIYSRLPFRSVRAIRGPGRAIDVEAQVIVKGAALVVVRIVHVQKPSFASSRLWLQTLHGLPPARSGVLRIIAGDFNSTLDHSPLRAVLDRGYADAAERAGRGLDATWPADRSFGIAIDHVLVDRRIGVDRVRIVRVTGTDHRAVIADLALPRQS